MKGLSINLLGTFQVRFEGEALPGFDSGRMRALLAYLLLHRDAPQPRRYIAFQFWSDSTESQALTNLRNTLYHLRRVLPNAESYINVTPPFLHWRVESHYACDVVELESVLEEIHQAEQNQDRKTLQVALESMVDIYKGDLLPACYDDWILPIRERLYQDFIQGMQQLIMLFEEQDDFPAVIAAAQRLLRFEPLQEVTYRQLMRAMVLNSQRALALAQYETCRDILQTELGIEPEVETTALYEQIRNGEFQAPQIAPPLVRVSPTAVQPPDVQTGVTLQSPFRSEGERRVVTALTAILKEATVQSGDVDLENWAEMLRAVIPVLEDELQSFGGEVHQVREDRLLALYGLAATHEDDPERAILTALSMQDAFQMCAANLPVIVKLRIGISTGEVIATTIGNQQNMSSALGQVTTLAERMAESAEPGTVLVAEAIYRLLEPLFEWEMLGRFQVRGVRTPVGVYRPIHHKGGLGKGRGIVGLSSSLVGREEEMQALQAAVENLRRGSGGIVTLVGEAGIGKSRLVAELKATESGANLNWLEGRCLSYMTNIAYQVWSQILRSCLSVGVEKTADEGIAILKSKVRTVCPDAYEKVYPFLVRLLSLPLDETSSERLRGIDAGGIQVLTFRAVEALLASLCQQQPMVLMCEDLHWADPTSLSLLEYLMPLTDQVPLLLVCVMRPVTEHECWHVRELASRNYPHRHTDLWLKPLSSTEGETLVGNLLRIEDLPVELRNRILERAEGNPFYLEEILRSLIEEEAITYEEVTDPSTRLETGHWVATGAIEDLRIPDTLHGVLAARIDRLETGAKHILQLASVIGRLFSYKVLAAIADSLRADELDSHLAGLQRAGLIRERARLPEREYIFKHVLTQEAVYNRLLKKECRQIHRKVAEGIEKLYPEKVEEQLGVLAYHWEQGDDQEKAVHYLRRAGEQAAAQYANVEAVDYLSRALNLVSEVDVEMRYNLLLAREKVYNILGKRELQIHDLSVLSDLAEELDVVDPQVGKSRLAEVKSRQIHLSVISGHLYVDSYGEVVEQAQRLLRIAEESHDLFAQVAANRDMGEALFYDGYFDDALYRIEQALDISRMAGLRDLEIDSLDKLGSVYLFIDVKKAQTTFEQALLVCQETGARSREGVVLRRLGKFFFDQGEYEKADIFTEESLRVCRETGNRREEGWALWLLGMIYFRQNRGNFEEIKEKSGQALEIFLETVDMGGVSNVYALLMAMAQSQGDFSKEMRYANQAIDIFKNLGDLWHQAITYRNIGWSLFTQARYADSQHYTEKAYALALELESPSSLFDPLSNLGRLYFVQGDYENAKKYAEEALSIAQNNTHWFRQICECLVTLGFTAHTAGDDNVALRYSHQLLALSEENADIYGKAQAKQISGHVLSGQGKWKSAAEAYKHAIGISEQHGFREISVEAKAGLSNLARVSGDVASSLALVEDILQYLQEKPQLKYFDEPFRVYLTCIQVLQANDDPRAHDILEQAYTLLQDRAATIEDEKLHHSFLNNVVENREIVALWERYQQDT